MPRRHVRARGLRPDFIIVSHRHPDHFDVASLHHLARLDPQTVVVTPDSLVAWAARTLGFETVHEVPAAQSIELDGVTLITTPSLAPDEWGLLVAAEGAVVWNQVDAVLRDAQHVRAVLSEAATVLGRQARAEARRKEHVDLAMVRWQPMLEIAAVLGRATGFPLPMYRDLLEQAAAVEAAAVVPGANGAAHVAAFRWMDRFVFPVSEARFLSDLARRQPQTRGLPLTVGGRYHVEPGSVTLDPTGASSLVELSAGPDPRHYRPFSIPPLCDPNPHAQDERSMRPRVRAWIYEDLARGLAEAWPSMKVDRTLRFCVDVVFGHHRDCFTVHVGSQGARVVDEADDNWDLVNEVAGSLLWEVIEGRRHWGDVLLAGCLRAASRAYAVGEQGIIPAAVGETFLYYGLSYEAAVERAVRWEVATLCRNQK